LPIYQRQPCDLRLAGPPRLNQVRPRAV